MPATLPAPASGRQQFLSSDLSRNSRSVFDAAEEAPVDITRRDGHHLVLMSQEEANAREELLGFAAQLIAAALDDDGPIGSRLADRFDWMLVFDDVVREQCAEAVIRAARASFSTNQAHLAMAELVSWKSTAEALAAGLDQEPVEWLDAPVPVERP